MNCPYCDFSDGLRPLHAHLSTDHPERVSFDEPGGRPRYGVECPICGEGYHQFIKPRFDDPSFLEEYRREIRLVAFDMLLSHLAGAHGDPQDLGKV